MTKQAPDWVAAERRDLAATLDGLSAEQWDAVTLCEGWRVSEVVAHITMPFRYSMARFALEMVKSAGNFNKMSDRRARADAHALSNDELSASLRDNATHPWTPPGGGFVGALSHDVIHGLDITVPLGIDRLVPADRLTMVLDSLTPKQVKYFGTDLAGVELVAEDRPWRYGSGAELSGRAQDLLLVLCGRRLPSGHLRGEPSGRFTSSA